jgi:branched-chain amino acid transport system permease protein
MNLQFLADGLITGSLIGLGAIGVTLTYSILRFSNFAHGDLMAWGAYAALGLVAAITALIGPVAPIGALSFGWPLILSAGIAMAVIGVMALVLDWLLFARLRAKGQAIIVGLGIRATPDQIILLLVTLVMVIALHLYMQRSQTGREMRAYSQNPDLARVVGIDVARIVRATWMIGGGLACLAGVMVGVLVQIRPLMGLDMLLPMFAAAILGGIGSVPGAVLAGLIIGLSESAAVQLVGAEWRAGVAFVILMGVLLIRPTGLFGVTER